MTMKIDLEKLVKEFKRLKLMNNQHESIAFNDDKYTELEDKDLDSIKDTLGKYDKIYVPLGFFGYDDQFYEDKPQFEFGLDCVDDEAIEDPNDDFEDSYYDKYKYLLGGYGIYVDSDLNVEHGYYTVEPPASGHGCGYYSYNDFKDAIADDRIRDEIESRVDSRDIWK